MTKPVDPTAKPTRIRNTRQRDGSVVLSSSYGPRKIACPNCSQSAPVVRKEKGGDICRCVSCGTEFRSARLK